jgi:hypothetical protein
VSGGALFAGILAKHLAALGQPNDNGVYDRELLKDLVVERCINVSKRGMDVQMWLKGLLSNRSITQHVAAEYEREVWRVPCRYLKAGKATTERLFEASDTLNTLPSDKSFVFNATTLNTGTRWSASRSGTHDRGFMRRFPRQQDIDRPSGEHIVVADAKVQTLSQAVAASGAFPPFLSPMYVGVKGLLFTPMLVDGGVFDNLGVEAAIPYKDVLVSDAGGVYDPVMHVGSPGVLGVPIRFQLWRVFNTIDMRARSHIVKALFDMYAIERDISAIAPQTTKDVYGRRVAFWRMDPDPPPELNVRERMLGARSSTESQGDSGHAADDIQLNPYAGHFANVKLLVVDTEMAKALARLTTRLAPMSDGLAKQIVNLGYAHCDKWVRAMWGDSSYITNLPVVEPDYPYKEVSIEFAFTPEPPSYQSHTLGLSLAQLLLGGLLLMAVSSVVISLLSGMALGNAFFLCMFVVTIALLIKNADLLGGPATKPVGAAKVHYDL